MLTPENLAALRASLENERDQLQQQVEDIDDDSEAIDDNFADSGQVAAELGEYRTLTATLTDQLTEIERALSKFDAGTYGVCEVGGEPIPLARLEAMPAARSCMEHA